MEVFVLAIVIALVQAQPTSVEDLQFAHPRVNLGELRSYVLRQHRFAFVNQGREAIEIVRVEPSCGCVAVKLEKRLFQPGERGEIVLDVKPTHQADGAHTWFAKVVYRAGERQETAHLQLEAVVRREVSIVPASLMWSGTSASHEVTVTDVRDPPLKVTNLHVTSPLVRAQVTSSDRGVTRIELQVAAEVPPGRHDEMLSIYSTDPDFNCLQVPLTLVGRTRKAIQVSPENVEQYVAAGQPIASTLIRLRPADGKTVKVRSVAADDAAITCTWAQGPYNEATVKIQVSAAKLGANELNSTVRVQVSEPVEETLIVPVRILR